jgi:hypothetical protein
MASVRLPRFQRDSNQIAPMRLTGRDREIVRLVHDHRFLRSDHITALVPGSRQQVLRRLKLLYHHGFVERPRCQIDYYQRGSRRMAYGIGNKGAVVLKRELALHFHQVHWNEKSRVGRIFLDHALLISDFMVAVEVACRHRSNVQFLSGEDAVPPLLADNEREPFQWTVDIGGRQNCGVVPDAVFGLEVAAANGKSERYWFFLEADCGTMPVTRESFDQSSFLRKLLAYRATWMSNLHRARFGFNRFRVLTITTNAERVEHMVQACSQLKSGQGLFLFAHPASLSTEPEKFFTNEWQDGFGKTESLF